MDGNLKIAFEIATFLEGIANMRMTRRKIAFSVLEKLRTKMIPEEPIRCIE